MCIENCVCVCVCSFECECMGDEKTEGEGPDEGIISQHTVQTIVPFALPLTIAFGLRVNCSGSARSLCVCVCVCVCVCYRDSLG